MGNRCWTSDELEFLKSNWGIRKIEYISKKLNRTEKSLRKKAYMLHLGRQNDNNEGITVFQLIKILGYANYSGARKKLELNGCPIYSSVCGKTKCMLVNIDEFWKWAEKKQDILNFTKFEENSLGMEPLWVKTKRINDVKESGNKKRRWTLEEESLLTSMVNNRQYTYEELQKIFGRGRKAIEKRIYTLGIKLRPIKKGNKYREYTWTQEQNILLTKMYYEGKTIDEIMIAVHKKKEIVKERVELFRAIDEKKSYRWTVVEIEYLKKYWGIKKLSELSNELERNQSNIARKAKDIGLISRRQRKKDI